MTILLLWIENGILQLLFCIAQAADVVEISEVNYNITSCFGSVKTTVPARRSPARMPAQSQLPQAETGVT